MDENLGKLVGIGTIRKKAKDLAKQIGELDFTIAGSPRGDGSSYIEVRGAYFFIVEERGIELERLKTSNLDELLYWIFDTMTFDKACDFELQNRKSGEDFRRQRFSKQETLLAQISPSWGQRKVEEHRTILERYPFSDQKR